MLRASRIRNRATRTRAIPSEGGASPVVRLRPSDSRGWPACVMRCVVRDEHAVTEKERSYRIWDPVAPLRNPCATNGSNRIMLGLTGLCCACVRASQVAVAAWCRSRRGCGDAMRCDLRKLPSLWQDQDQLFHFHSHLCPRNTNAPRRIMFFSPVLFRYLCVLFHYQLCMPPSLSNSITWKEKPNSRPNLNFIFIVVGQMIICALQGRMLRRRPIQKGHYWGNSRPFPCPALPYPPELKWRRSDSEGGTVE